MRHRQTRLICLLTGVLASPVVGCVAALSQAPGSEAAPIFGITVPPGYRDWRLISVAHEAEPLNDLRAILGNETAVKAYRDGRLPFPDGSIIARLAWSHVSSEENNEAFGRFQSFVAGSPTNVQFMVKDSEKYANTGGWGFAQFNGSASAGDALHATCWPCHKLIAQRDFVFTKYAR